MKIRQVLKFEKMVSPWLLQLLFWPAAAASIFYSSWLILEGNNIGWVPLIVGTLFIRVLFESLILRFRTYEKLQEIEQLLRKEEIDGDSSADI